MQIRRLAVAAFSLAIATHVSSEAVWARSASAVSVDIRSGGDDGLTNRFSDALAAAFSRSATFRISRNGEAPRLIVNVPTNVWNSGLGNEIEVKAVVNFTSASSEPVGTAIVTCFDDKLLVCANQVVDYAKTLHAY